MCVCKWTLTSAVVLFAVASSPSSASADWLLAPYIGVNWGAVSEFKDAALSYNDDFEPRSNFGASLVWQRRSPLAFEIDFGFSPDFFGDTGDPNDYQFGDSSITTVMANAKFDAPFQAGGIRPYGSGGIGLIRTHIKDPFDLFEVNSTDWGVNVGGGGVGFFTSRFGVRGDVRYFHAFQDNEPDDELDFVIGSLRFWRGTVGLVIRF